MSNREGSTTIVGRWIRGLRASALSLAIGANGMALGAEPAAQTAPEAVKDVGTSRTELRPLFNGKNLDGWYLFLQKYGRDSDPEKVVTIDDGILHAYKDARNGAEVVMGYIGTRESYSDYQFQLHYRWGKKQFKPRYLYKPDAGIYYHHVAKDVVWPQAMQFQLELNGVGDLMTVGAIKLDTTVDPATKTEEWQEYLAPERGGVPYETTGKGVSYTRKGENFERDGWNRLDLICKGDSALQMVNGHVVSRGTKIRQQDPNDPNRWIPLTGGRILIEFEASEISYRDIGIRKLAPDETLEAAAVRASASAKTGATDGH
ncbi:MAG: hypothetical protein ABS79_08045 [Planctomycetes bacterium SCN 63-9]|nr:MAG: hypothetical protein ABS79_08045 [Planctomycetes bacterium SCN 63-9]